MVTLGKPTAFDSDWIFQAVLKGGKVKPNFKDNVGFFVNALIAEKKWQKLFLSEKRESKRLYKIFIEERGGKANLRGVRVFFRQRQAENFETVYMNIKNKNVKGLQKVQVNASFCNWVFERYQGKNRKQLEELFEEYKVNRNKLIINNAPLILRVASKAKRSMPKNILPEVSSSAFLAAIEAVDKYCPKYKDGMPIYSDNILSCISSRIQAALGLMLANRDIYLGFKGRRSVFLVPRLLKEGLTEEQICKKLKMTPEEIKRIAPSASTEYIEKDFIKEKSQDLTPEESVTTDQEMTKLKTSLKSLSLKERKFLVLKGLASLEVLD